MASGLLPPHCSNGAASLPDRAEIVAAAHQSLVGSGYAALRRVSAVYDKGVLTLRGQLPSYHLKQVAQSVTGRVEGVERIANEIDVIWREPNRF